MACCSYLPFHLHPVISKPPPPVLHGVLTWLLQAVFLGYHTIQHVLDRFRWVMLELHHAVRQLSVELPTAFIRTFQAADHVRPFLPTRLFLDPCYLILISE